MQSRIKYIDYVKTLISSEQYSFDESLEDALPLEPGIYRILESSAKWSSSLLVGRTKTATDELRYRVYQNQYKGNHKGNIKAQLVKSGRFKDQDGAKRYLEEKCRVQFIVIEDENERKWAEHFILSILQPELTD
jgi:hypothetical protein